MKVLIGLFLLASWFDITIVFIAIGGFFLYFAPTFTAMLKKHRNGAAIFALNVLLGWTFIGWVAALVWSLTEPKDK